VREQHRLRALEVGVAGQVGVPRVVGAPQQDLLQARQGGDLRAPFIIHAVVESPEESLSAFGVQRALVNGLRRAQEWEMASLSVPPLGLGAGSLEPEEWASMVVELLLNHVREGEPPREITIVVESEYEEDLFRRLLAAAQV